MAAAVNNVSFDGSTVQFRMDSPLLACFDPLALDLLGELLPPGAPMDVSAFLERANANNASLACLTIPDFRPGFYALDPRDIKKFGDEDEGLDYSESEPETDDGATDYVFAGVDSGALIFADVVHLPKLVTLLTWEQYDRSLGDDTILPRILERLGGPFFAVVVSDSRLGMQFDGDGTYTVVPACLRRISG